MNGISIIIPFYNTKKGILKRCLDSIKTQNYPYLEVIIINDGSTKDYSYLKEYNYKIINTKHLGVSNARNIGVKNSTFDNIVFIDADDTLVENALNVCNKYINKHNKYDIIIFDTYVIYEKIKVKNLFYNNSGKLSRKDINNLQLQAIYKNYNEFKPREISVGPVWAKIYNKEFLQKNNIIFFDELHKCQDTLFNLYAFEKAKNIYHENEYVYNYYKNINDSSCNNIYHNIEKTRYYFIEKFIKENNKDNDFKQALKLGIIENLYIILNKHVFIKGYKNYISQVRELKKIAGEELYFNAINNSKGRNFKEKIFICFLKNKMYFSVGILKSI